MTKDEALRLALEALEKSLPRLAPYGEQDWLDSKEAITAIKAALSGEAQQVKDEPVAHSVVAGALFDFMGWLTSREKRLILSSVDEASPAVEAITEFAKKRNLSLKYAEVGYWMEFLSTPPQRTWVGLSDDEIYDSYNEPRSDAEMVAFAREVEAKLKEKNV